MLLKNILQRSVFCSPLNNNSFGNFGQKLANCNNQSISESFKIHENSTFKAINHRFPTGLQRLAAGLIVDHFGPNWYQKKHNDQSYNFS